MTLSLFDLTEHTQLSVRGPTGCHPDGLSLGVFISTEPIHTLGGHPAPLEFNAYDAVEWDRALRMAEWILKADEQFNTEPHACRAQIIDPEDGKIMDTDIRPEHKCPFCGARNLFGIKTRTNIYCGETNQTEAVLRCHGCGSTVSAFGDTYEKAKHVALAKWETRPQTDPHRCKGCPECAVVFDTEGIHGHAPDRNSRTCQSCERCKGADE